MIGGFVQAARRRAGPALAWWLGELAALAPAGVKTLLIGDRRRILVQSDAAGLSARLVASGGGIEIDCRHDGEHWSDAATFKQLAALARTRAVTFLAPEPFVLRQEVKLPRAALARLDQAVAYGLPTWSPFSADEVWVAARVIGADAAQATVSLAYALKADLAPLLESAAQAGLAPDHLAFDEAGLATLSLRTKKLRRLGRARRIDLALAASALALAVALTAAILWRQATMLESLQAAVRLELDAVKRDEAGAKAVDAIVARRTIVARRRAAEPGAAEILAAAGDRLPASASLALFEWSPGKGRIQVVGAAAEDILPGLRKEPRLAEPSVEAAPPGRPVSIAFKPARVIP